MGRIITIKLLPTLQKLTESTLSADETADMLTEIAGKTVAQGLREIIREPLAKKTGIGASGKSWSAVKYRKGRKKGKGNQEYIIYESTGGANPKIRMGIKPGEQGSMGQLRQWAIAKRIPLKPPHNFASMANKWDSGNDRRTKTQTMRDYSAVRYISPKQKRRIRPWKADQDKFTAAITKIHGALEREGTNRPPEPERGVMGAAWWFKYPSGQGRFDYVAYAIRNKQPAIRAMLSDASKDVRAGILSHVLSGRGRTGMSSSITIKRYI